MNSKAAAGRAKKEENEAKKNEAERQKLAVQEAKEWEKGANLKKAARDGEAAMKADEAARKRREKQELLEAEEAAMGGKAAVRKPGPTAGSKKKNKKKDDLSMLEDALVKSADKKVRKKKEEALKKQQQQKELQEQAAAKRQEEKLDPLMANTEAMIGSTDGDNVGRDANKDRMEAEGSGLDGALQSLDISAPSEALSAKALYAKFEAKMLPEMKEDYPGLRLSQYKDKIFQLWKKSPENPANQRPTES